MRSIWVSGTPTAVSNAHDAFDSMALPRTPAQGAWPGFAQHESARLLRRSRGAPSVSTMVALPSGLTQGQVDAALAKNKTWPYPGVEDGWFLAHGGLRLDMAGAFPGLSRSSGSATVPEPGPAWGSWLRWCLGCRRSLFA